MIKIYLTRHGQDEDNARGILNGHHDTNLTELGLKQVEELAQKIKKLDLTFDKVYCSPLKRTFQTAEKITTGLGLAEPEKLDMLIERDFGVMTEKLVADIEKLCAPDIIQTETVTYFLSPSGAETFPELLARAKKTLEFINNKYQQGNILLVTHGDFGKMLYAAYHQLDWQQVLTMFHFGNSELLLLSADLSPEETHIFNAKQYNK